jgi:hypothetical protein
VWRQRQKNIDADQAHHQPTQLREIARANDLIHNLPLKEGREQAQAGIDQEQGASENKGFPVGAEVAQETFQCLQCRVVPFGVFEQGVLYHTFAVYRSRV